MITEHVARRIALLRARAGAFTDPRSLTKWFRQDVEELTADLVRLANSRIRFAEVEAALAAAAKQDVKALRAATDLFRNIDPGQFIVDERFGGKPPAYSIERLDSLVEDLRSPEDLEELEILLRLDMRGDRAFDLLLCTLRDVSLVADGLRQLLLPKAHLLTEEQVLKLWEHMLAESDSTAELRLERDPSVVPETFFAMPSLPVARERLVDYRVSIRPRLEQAMVLKGARLLPILPVGVARMLAWENAASTREPSRIEQRALRTLARIAVCADRLGTWNDETLSGAASVPKTGLCLHGRLYQDAKRHADPSTDRVHQQILDELEHLLGIAQELHAEPTPLEIALRAFKLGLEVQGPDIRDGLRLKNELALQRQLCRFLVERDVRAFGTKFGNAELDVLAEDAFATLLVEVKRFDSVPSPGALNLWAAQLLSYMDQAPRHHRGVLVLFNFSSTTITGPLVFTRGRMLVLPINVCAASPSNRRGCVAIEPAPDDSEDMIRVTRPVRTPDRSKKRLSQNVPAPPPPGRSTRRGPGVARPK
jgi:hypothetical protein